MVYAETEIPKPEPSVHWVYSKNVSLVCLVGIMDLGTVLGSYCCGETLMTTATLAYGFRGLVYHSGKHDSVWVDIVLDS